MIIVSDTSPINYLILIGQVDALYELYRQVGATLALPVPDRRHANHLTRFDLEVEILGKPLDEGEPRCLL